MKVDDVRELVGKEASAKGIVKDVTVSFDGSRKDITISVENWDGVNDTQEETEQKVKAALLWAYEEGSLKRLNRTEYEALFTDFEKAYAKAGL